MLRSLKLSLLLLLLSAPAFGQSAVMSTDFWLSYLPSTDTNARSWLLITSPVIQRISFETDGRSLGTTLVGPGGTVEREIGASEVYPKYWRPDRTGVIQRKSIHLRSQAPISVQQFTTGFNSVSLSLPLPTAYLGRSYVVMSYNDQPAGPNELSNGVVVAGALPKVAGEFLVIAPSDSTHVRIVLSANTSDGHHRGDTISVLMQQGETYWMKGSGDSTTNDLTGTSIEADMPIAVQAGAEAMMGLDKVKVHDNFFWNDHIAEYLPPVEQWGTEYVGTPLANKNGAESDAPFGDLYRIVAKEETLISINGVTQPAGTRWEIPRTSQPVLIRSEKPVMVAQYDYFVHPLSSATPPRTSNAMQMLTPKHQWVNEVLFAVPSGFTQTYIYVTAHRDSIDLIKAILGGTAQPIPIKGLRSSAFKDQLVGEYVNYTLIIGKQGAHRLLGPCTFQALNHGTQDLDASVTTYGYASAVGSTFGWLSNDDFAVSLDTSCSSFAINVEDTATDGAGIAEILILDQELHGKDYFSSNMRFNKPLPAPGAKAVNASVLVEDPFKAGTAYVLIRSVKGKEKIVTLRYSAPLITYSGDLAFPNTHAGDTVCEERHLQNLSALPVTIDSVYLQHSDSPFTLHTTQAFPLRLDSGQSFDFTICYAPRDTASLTFDSVVIMTPCFRAASRIEGSSSVGSIYAEDLKFGTVILGGINTGDIRIHNLSKQSTLTLTGAEFASDVFTLDPTDLARFPITLTPSPQAGSRTTISIEYKPLKVGKDIARILWKTDIPSELNPDSNLKAWSILTGQAVENPLAVQDEADTRSIMIGDGIFIELEAVEEIRSVMVSDLLGITVETGHALLNALPSGIYFLRVETTKRVITRKIIR